MSNTFLVSKSLAKNTAFLGSFSSQVIWESRGGVLLVLLAKIFNMKSLAKMAIIAMCFVVLAGKSYAALATICMYNCPVAPLDVEYPNMMTKAQADAQGVSALPSLPVTPALTPVQSVSVLPLNISTPVATLSPQTLEDIEQGNALSQKEYIEILQSLVYQDTIINKIGCLSGGKFNIYTGYACTV